MVKTAPKRAKSRGTEDVLSNHGDTLVNVSVVEMKSGNGKTGGEGGANGQTMVSIVGESKSESLIGVAGDGVVTTKKRGRPRKIAEMEQQMADTTANQQQAQQSMDRLFVNPKQRDVPRPPPSKLLSVQFQPGKQSVNMLNFRGTRFLLTEFVTVHLQHKVAAGVPLSDPRHPSFQCQNGTHHVGKILKFSLDNSPGSQWMSTIQLCRQHGSSVAVTTTCVTVPVKLIRDHCFVLTTAVFEELKAKFPGLDVRLYATILQCNLKEFHGQLVPWFGGDCRLAVAEVYVRAASRLEAGQGLSRYIQISDHEDYSLMSAARSIVVGQQQQQAPLMFRENEYQQLYKFLKGNISRRACGTMYIAGMPGTGKSATVQRVFQTQSEEQAHLPKYKVLHINAAMLGDPNDVLPVIYQHFTKLRLIGTQADAKLTEFFQDQGRTNGDIIVLVLDEIDYLITKDQALQYKVVEWPALPNAKVIIVGISNTFDLPNRLLSRVESRIGLAKLLFEPYSKPQLLEITKTYLPAANKTISEDALNLAASRVAASNGDARRMIALCRQAIFDHPSHVDIHHMDATMKKLYETNVLHAVQHSPIQDQQFLLALLHCLSADNTIDGPPVHAQLVLTRMAQLSARVGLASSVSTQIQYMSPLQRLRQAGVIALKPLLEVDQALLSLTASYDTVHFALNKNPLLAPVLPKK